MLFRCALGTTHGRRRERPTTSILRGRRYVLLVVFSNACENRDFSRKTNVDWRPTDSFETNTYDGRLNTHGSLRRPPQGLRPKPTGPVHLLLARGHGRRRLERRSRPNHIHVDADDFREHAVNHLGLCCSAVSKQVHQPSVAISCLLEYPRTNVVWGQARVGQTRIRRGSGTVYNGVYKSYARCLRATRCGACSFYAFRLTIAFF